MEAYIQSMNEKKLNNSNENIKFQYDLIEKN